MRSLRKIIDTNHALERFLQRYSKTYTRPEVNDVIYNAMEKIMDFYEDESAVYAVYSNSTGICVIIDWRPDYKEVSGKNHAIIVTLPPPKRNYSDFKTTSPSDVKMMVELFLSRKIDRKTLKESTSFVKTFEFNGMVLALEDGEIYDYGIDHYIIL